MEVVMNRASAGIRESISPLLLLAAAMALALGVSSSSGSRPFDTNWVSEVSVQSSKPVPEAIFKRWVHSHEDDIDDKKVFRPYGTRMPRSRGRMGFEMKPDGVFMLYAIAAGDGIEPIRGRWRLTEPGVVVATLEDETTRSYSFEILSCEDNLLTIREKQ